MLYPVAYLCDRYCKRARRTCDLLRTGSKKQSHRAGPYNKGKDQKTWIITLIALFVPQIVLPPAMVYGINGAEGFWSGFIQILVILMMAGLFDRLFIDWWWVGHTKAWVISGTEDLMPYIYGKTLVKKWLGTIVGFPILAALLAGVMQLIL